MKQGRQRIDQLLVTRNLAESREKAQAMLLAGEVLVNGQRVTKAGAPVDETAAIEVLARMPWVSRGGYKILGALEHWGIDVTGRVCADVGSSTGGFTDCLLQHGAARVHCVDVGVGQLHWKLRNDPRVVIHEGVNARYLEPSLLGEPVALVVCDVSFISVTLILPMLPPLLLPDGEIVILVKPQFEVGRGQVGKGGIVRDPALHEAVCKKAEDAARMLGFQTSLMESPLPGAEGNKEFLLYGTGRHSRDHREA
ncbi:MAG: TlyA family RNA methyltransferase [Bryobacteraceae bacterium]|nr:TlyA family RNA methyltransferase [Bryobacteraceae bacterium]